MNIKEKSLKQALTSVRVPELPKQYREGDGEYWLEAIVLVCKRDGSLSYAVAKRGVDGVIRYISDYGNMSQIKGLISIHPYTYLNNYKYIQSGSAEQKRAALIQFIGGDRKAEEAVSPMTDEEVENMLLNIEIEAQYRNKAIETTHSRIIGAVKGSSYSVSKNEDESKTETNMDASKDKMSDCAEVAEENSTRVHTRRTSTRSRKKTEI